MRKKGKLVDYLILLILGLLVLAAVFFFLFKADILEWLRNLPEYNYTDPEVGDLSLDEETAYSICKGANYVGFVGDFNALELNKDYISFFIKDLRDGKIKEASTKLYWKGGEKNGEIYLKQMDFQSIFGKSFLADWAEKDLLVAKSDKNGVIWVEKDLLDYGSEFYQTTRFSGRPPEVMVIPKLDAAYFVDANKLCREGGPAKMVEAWPGGDKIINLDLRMYVDPETGKVVTQLDKYFNLGEDIRFLYLENKGDYILVRGMFKISDQRPPAPLKIYPDGSVWFLDSQDLTFKDGSGVIMKEEYAPDLDKFYRETNLRVNYDEARKLIDGANREGFTEPAWSDSEFNEKCVIKIAKILKEGEILLSDTYCKRASSSGLVFDGYPDGYPQSGKIKFGSSVFAEVKDNKVTLTQGLIDKSGDLYRDVVVGGISDMCILNLQNSEFISGYLCRSKAIIPGYSGTTIYKTITINGKTIEVELTYDDNGICRVVEGPIDWLGRYGLKNGGLLYLDSSWNTAEILNNEQITEITDLRKEQDTIVNAKKNLKTEDNLPIGFKSTSGLYFNQGSKFYYFPSDVFSSPVFTNALSQQGLDIMDKGSEGHYYILMRIVSSPFIQNPISYGIDASFIDSAEGTVEKNVLYSYNPSTKSWNKLDSGVYSYIYVLENDWSHIILRENVKEELTKVCK